MKDDFNIKFSLPYLCIFSLEGWENVLFELRSGRVNPFIPKHILLTLQREMHKGDVATIGVV